MALTSRISLVGPPASSPEDYLGSSLGVIFPDDVMNQHGGDDHTLRYTSPHLPKPLHFDLAEPATAGDRRLFSHYVWNASLLLAELVEAATLGLPAPRAVGPAHGPPGDDPLSLGTPPSEASAHFDVTGLSTIELGAGTALPSILSALLGASRVVITDYPAPAVMQTLRANVGRNIQPSFSPSGAVTTREPVQVEGHSWGELSPSDPFTAASRHAFDRVFVADCLWMPWQHANLARSISWFLRDDSRSRCWVVAGFHTGREKMRPFFHPDALAAAGLEIDHIWEQDCDYRFRKWEWDGPIEDSSTRKRWLVVAILKRRSVVVAVEPSS